MGRWEDRCELRIFHNRISIDSNRLAAAHSTRRAPRRAPAQDTHACCGGAGRGAVSQSTGRARAGQSVRQHARVVAHGDELIRTAAAASGGRLRSGRQWIEREGSGPSL